MSRTNRQRLEHQGALTGREKRLADRMKNNPKRYFTTLEICRVLGCVSARDAIRKLQAAGVKIGPAQLLRTTEDGRRVYGWRIAP